MGYLHVMNISFELSIFFKYAFYVSSKFRNSFKRNKSLNYGATSMGSSDILSITGIKLICSEHRGKQFQILHG